MEVTRDGDGVYTCGKAQVTEELLVQILTEPWKWAASRENLDPDIVAAIERILEYVETHGFD